MTILKAEAMEIEHLLTMAAKDWEEKTLKWYNQELDEEFGAPISEDLCQRALSWASTLRERRDSETKNQQHV